MKRVSKQVITYRDVFIADDETEFKTEEECERYEQKIACIVRTRFFSIAEKIEHGHSVIDSLLDNGNCNSSYYLVTPKTDTDIHTICMFIESYGGDIEVQGGKKYLGNGNIQLGQKYIVLEDDCWAGIYQKDCVIADYKEKLDRFSKLFDEEEKENG